MIALAMCALASQPFPVPPRERERCAPSHFSQTGHAQFSGSNLLGSEAPAWDLSWSSAWLDGLRSRPDQATPPALALPDCPAIIASARRLLSLNVSDLSRIVGVSRPTVYAWADGSAQIKQENRQRLTDLEAVAQQWFKLAGDNPLGHLLRAPLAPRQPSILDLLSASNWEQPAIESALQKLANTAAHLATRKPLTLDEIHAKRGGTPTPLPEAETDRLISLTAGVKIPQEHAR